MSSYSFCKKDGDIKARYGFACRQIISCRKIHREVEIGRNGNVVEVYDCYAIPKIELCSPKKRSYISKVKEVCENFNVKTRDWHSLNEVVIDLMGDNVSFMIKEIEKLLGGDVYIR